jgi:16S rRNA (uracil1498-N3)-methyltransferase
VHRFFAPSLDAGDETVALPRDEADHLTRVLRLGVGDTVAVFDGRGNEFLGRVTAAARRDVRVQLLSRLDAAAEPHVALTLVQAVLKADKMDEVVRDAVMLGVAAIQPIVTRRTEMTVATLLKAARVDRWRRVAVASVKQSRRAVVPDLRLPLSFDNFLDEPPPALRLMLVEPGAERASGALSPERAPDPLRSLSTLQGQPTPADAALIVGPEGGWTADECAAASARSVRLVTLGHRTLRADAVSVAAICVLQFLWGDL